MKAAKGTVEPSEIAVLVVSVGSFLSVAVVFRRAAVREVPWPVLQVGFGVSFLVNNGSEF